MTTGPDNRAEVMLSIIVPVFNVEPFLRDGLDSILEQNFAQPYETILVDDCSTDGSLEICQEFTSRYPEKFRLFESPANAGVSAARNVGLDNARGDYFMFVDPDDLLPLDALQSLYTAATQIDSILSRVTIRSLISTVSTMCATTSVPSP